MTQNNKEFDLLFGVQRSVLYHSRRRQFYERWHFKVITTLIIATFVLILLPSSSITLLSIISAGIVFFLCVLFLIKDFSAKALLHSDLARRFIQLEKQIILNESPCEIDSLVTQRLDIEADEPPVLHVLNTLCHNELMRAKGFGPEQWAKIGWLQRQFAHYFDFREHTIRNQ